MIFITANAVADLIGATSGDAFLRQRDRLETEHGFPLPMPTATRPLRWRREQVAAWVQAQGRPQAAQAAALAGAHNVHLLQRAASR
jgi:predicted DNA-binding transcriptional regulator AlpA